MLYALYIYINDPIDQLLPPSSNRVGFERNGDSEGGECRALSAIVTVARLSMESDPVWMALL
jgi:hypothetical protein